MPGRGRGRPRHPDLLTPGEQRVLEELRKGGTNAEIAVRLRLSPETVKTHIASMLGKLDLEGRQELAEWRPEGERRGLRALLSMPAGFFSVAHPLMRAGLGVAAVAGVVAVAIVLVLPQGNGERPAVVSPPSTATPTPAVPETTPTEESSARDVGTQSPTVEEETPVAHIEYGLPCGPVAWPYTHVDHQGFLRWGDGGDTILFDFDAFAEVRVSWVMVLEVPTGRLRILADRTWDKVGFHADILPGTPEIVTTTCDFVGEPREYYSDPGEEILKWSRHRYELAKISLDGEVERLTESPEIEHFPVWSPDGQRIAYLHLSERGSRKWEIYTMAADGSDARLMTGDAVVPQPLVWSPDGRLLAYVAEAADGKKALYTQSWEGRERWRVVEARYVGLPSWSPDGQYLVFGTSRRDESRLHNESGLYLARADGSGLQLLYAGPTLRVSENPGYLVTWSPDGEEILFAEGLRSAYGFPELDDPSLYLIQPDGSNLRQIVFESFTGVRAIAWSPDGAEFAVHGYRDPVDLPHRVRGLDGGDSVADEGEFHLLDGGGFLMTLPRGASGEEDPGVRTWARAHFLLYSGAGLGVFMVPEETEPLLPLAPGLCAAGVGVPDPDENPGLVADCEVLVAVRDTLADEALLLWGAGPVSGWEGVTVEGSPPRVREISLRGLMLTGRIPPELAELSELRVLDLSLNMLRGELPPELGGLAKLEVLELRGNGLFGPVPPEWGRLSNLNRFTLPWSVEGCLPAGLPEPYYSAGRC